MKKTLLIAAAALAAGLTASQAQVYSQNVVGYVNLPVISGYHMYSNPLDVDGTGTNNTVTTCLGTNLPAGSQLLTWNGATFDINNFTIPKHQTVPVWDNPNAPLNPGDGVFIYNAGASNTVTTVGTVLQGALTNAYLPAGGGYYAVSSQVPLAGGVVSVLGYQPTVGDQVLLWDDAIQSYDIYNYIIAKHATTPSWDIGEPVVSVGQGFFINTANPNPVWNVTFNVQ